MTYERNQLADEDAGHRNKDFESIVKYHIHDNLFHYHKLIIAPYVAMHLLNQNIIQKDRLQTDMCNPTDAIASKNLVKKTRLLSN